MNRGIRLGDLSLSELISFIYAITMKDADYESRIKFNNSLIGATEEELEILPDRLKGMRVPDFWLATENTL